MIASPGDVAEERKIVTQEIHRWNDAHALSRNIILQPVKWETNSTPRFGQTAQAELNEQIAEQSDILIGIFGTRIGTRTEQHPSGTVEEITNHVRAGKTAKVYFSDAPVSPSTIDPEQYSDLQSFKEKCKGMGLYATYVDLASFERDFKQHLDIELNAPRYLVLAISEERPHREPVGPSSDARLLLCKAAKGRGVIIFRSVLGSHGMLVVENEQLTDTTPRSVARWRAALNELIQLKFALETKPASGVFELTHLGYKASEKADAARPVDITARTAGKPDHPQLEIEASRSVKLLRIDYLHSTEACIVSQDSKASGEKLTVDLDHAKMVQLNNSGRPDKNPYDHSGPAKLRLVFELDGVKQPVILPVHLEPRIVASTQWITLTGSSEATLSPR